MNYFLLFTFYCIKYSMLDINVEITEDTKYV